MGSSDESSAGGGLTGDGQLGVESTSIRARTTPRFVILSWAAAACERSAMRRPMFGPRSFTRTITLRPFRRFVTLTRVPNGSVGCAIVRSAASDASPLAVGRSWNDAQYQ